MPAIRQYARARGIAAMIAMFAMVVVVVLGIGATAPVAAHAAKDPVMRTIDKARAKGKISRAKARQYRKTWRGAARAERKLRRSGKSSRALEIGNARAIALNLARRSKLGSRRLEPVLSNVRATTYVFRFRSVWPRAYQRMNVPFDKVVFAYYPGQGMQFQPLFTFAHANKLYSQDQNMLLAETMDRALELSVTPNGFPTWEYYFSFGGGSPPWVSAMAQATAVQALGRTWKRTGTGRYRRVAEAAMKGFGVKASSGGLMTKVGKSGRWYPLYGFLPHQRVLNGHLQVMLGLDEFQRLTGSRRARVLVNKGVHGLGPNLHKFDTGAWSNYVPGVEANINYHDLQTGQLVKLGKRLGIDRYSRVGRRFGLYRVTAPEIIVPDQKIRPLYPKPTDGWRDSEAISYFLDKRSKLIFKVRNSRGKTVRRIVEHLPRGRHRLIWDGRNNAGRVLGEGAFTIEVKARDIIGNVRRGQLTGKFQIRRDRVDPIISTVARRGARKVIVRGGDHHSPWVKVQLRRKGKIVDRATMRGNRTVLRTPKGVRARGSIIRMIDTSGNVTHARVP